MRKGQEIEWVGAVEGRFVSKIPAPKIEILFTLWVAKQKIELWMGDTGIYLSLACAEAATFVLSFVFFLQNTPSRLIREQDRPAQRTGGPA